MKVLIVDDEYFSRQGIEKFISDMNQSFKIFLAADGFEGMKIVREEKIDIVITDIRMPKLTGLEMVETLKKEGHSFEFIIISGYDDFSYAQKALKMGAVDFILKPVRPEEIVTSVNMLLEKTRQDRYFQQNYVERHLLRVLNGDEVNSDIINNFFSSRPLFLLVLEVNQNGDDTVWEKEDFILELKNALVEHSCLYVTPKPDRYAVLGSLSDNVQRAINDFIEKSPVSMTVVYSAPVKDGLVYTAYTNVNEWLESWLYLPTDVLVSTQPAAKKQFTQEELATMVRKLRLSIRGGYRTNMLKDSKKLFEFFSDTFTPYNTVTRTLISLRVFTREFLANGKFPPVNLPDPPLGKRYSLTTLEDSFNEFLTETSKVIASKMSDRQGAVNEALFYIENNYTQDISLNNIAKEVHLNPSYLSRKIKEYTNLGFSKYLLQLRMEKAIELLRQDYSIKEVAKAVGYNDYRQFSTQFKDYTGESPSRYRK